MKPRLRQSCGGSRKLRPVSDGGGRTMSGRSGKLGRKRLLRIGTEERHRYSPCEPALCLKHLHSFTARDTTVKIYLVFRKPRQGYRSRLGEPTGLAAGL